MQQTWVIMVFDAWKKTTEIKIMDGEDRVRKYLHYITCLMTNNNN